MGRLVGILALVVLGCASHPSTAVLIAPEAPIRFVQPRTSLSMSGMAGVDIPVQLLIERHPENRAFEIAWNGIGCRGSSARTLDGEFAERLQPPMKPLVIRMTPGTCEITAILFGPGGAVRARTSFLMRICGGEGDCDQ